MPVIRIVGATEIRTPLVIVPFPSSALDMSTVEKSLPVLQRQIVVFLFVHLFIDNIFFSNPQRTASPYFWAR